MCSLSCCGKISTRGENCSLLQWLNSFNSRYHHALVSFSSHPHRDDGVYSAGISPTHRGRSLSTSTSIQFAQSLRSRNTFHRPSPTQPASAIPPPASFESLSTGTRHSVQSSPSPSSRNTRSISNISSCVTRATAKIVLYASVRDSENESRAS